MLINKKIALVSLLVILTLFFLINGLVLAQNPPDLREDIQTNMSQAGTNAGYNVTETGETNTDTIEEVIGKIISYILGFLGVIFLILIIYSGFQWMTAGGNEETITKAKKRLTNAAIGLVIVFTAYVITYFITNVLLETTNYAN